MLIHPVPARWFRIPYAQNALVRSLAVPLATLTLPEAHAGVVAFERDYRPQHAELDESSCSWGASDGHFECRFERRMHRHDHADATLSLVFRYALTAARAELGGSTELDDARASAGYRAVARAVVLHRALTLRGGGPRST